MKTISRSIKKLAASVVTAALLIAAPGFPHHESAAAASALRAAKVNGAGSMGVAPAGRLGVVGTPNLEFGMGSRVPHLTATLGFPHLTATLGFPHHESAAAASAMEPAPLTLAALMGAAPAGRLGVVGTPNLESRMSKDDTPTINGRKLRAAAGLGGIVSAIRAVDKNAGGGDNSSGMWASLTNFWERAELRRGEGSGMVAATIEPGRSRSSDLGRASKEMTSIAVNRSERPIVRRRVFVASSRDRRGFLGPDAPGVRSSRGFAHLGLMAALGAVPAAASAASFPIGAVLALVGVAILAVFGRDFIKHELFAAKRNLFSFAAFGTAAALAFHFLAGAPWLTAIGAALIPLSLATVYHQRHQRAHGGEIGESIGYAAIVATVLDVVALYLLASPSASLPIAFHAVFPLGVKIGVATAALVAYTASLVHAGFSKPLSDNRAFGGLVWTAANALILTAVVAFVILPPLVLLAIPMALMLIGIAFAASTAGIAIMIVANICWKS